MKNYKIVKRCSMWSTSRLIREVEELLPEMVAKGYDIVSVSFGVNIWWIPTAYITICKEEIYTTEEAN